MKRLQPHCREPLRSNRGYYDFPNATHGSSPRPERTSTFREFSKRRNELGLERCHPTPLPGELHVLRILKTSK
jgi:hypothetical protein